MGARLRMENLEFVLVEPRNPGNVGAAARALFNMGVERLCLVGWEEDDNSRQIAFDWATDGEQVLKNARRCKTLEEAVSDCGLTIAMSARKGADRCPPLLRREVIEQLERWTQKNRVAFVFGPERTGLRREHLQLCSYTYMISTASAPRSLNLAQAVLLVAYDILMASDRKLTRDERVPRSVDRIATRNEREQLRGHVTEMLKAVDFLRTNRSARPIDELGRLLDRAETTSHEVQILHGICRSVLQAVENRKTK